MQSLKQLFMSGADVLPLVEGGKGIGVSNGLTAGSWAAAGGIGTFSGVNADFYDEHGQRVPIVYKGSTRRERHHELIDFGIRGGVAQARIAHDVSAGRGRIHMNVLWEMGGVEPILHGILERAKGLIHGITCGAGMPYKLSTIAAQYGVYYYPIVSSARAFNALWRRAYHKVSEWLGAVVYEDPWLAGGHNGLSNSENPKEPESPYPRVAELRKVMNAFGLASVPIIMAGGVWFLRDWQDWIDNPDIGPIAFQFGTRPLLTQESPIPLSWKQKLRTLKPGDIYLNRFSPTGFYSSAVENAFLRELIGRSERQIAYRSNPENGFDGVIHIGPRRRPVYVPADAVSMANNWVNQGFTEAMRTPDETLIFVTPDRAAQIHQDQVNCMGCLSACKFSNWSQEEDHAFTTGKKADPRSFCIQKTLQDAVHTDTIDHQLMFAGHGAYRFAQDPFYADGNIPTVSELVARIQTGD